MRICLAQDFRSARSSMFSRRNLCSSARSDSLIWAGLARRSRGLSSSPAPPRSTLGPSTLQTSSCRPYNTSSARPIGSTPSRTISGRRRPATTWTPETGRPERSRSGPSRRSGARESLPGCTPELWRECIKTGVCPLPTSGNPERRDRITGMQLIGPFRTACSCSGPASNQLRFALIGRCAGPVDRIGSGVLVWLRVAEPCRAFGATARLSLSHDSLRRTRH